MKRFLLISLMMFVIGLYAQKSPIVIDSLSNKKMINKDEAVKLAIFPEYPTLEQACLYESPDGQLYFEIMYKNENILIADRYNITKEQLEEIRQKIRTEREISLKKIKGPPDSVSEYNQNKNEGKLIFVWGYSVLTASIYGVSLPIALFADNNNGKQAAGSYLLITGGALAILINSTKDKQISVAEANLSLDYAVRGLFHGSLFFKSLLEVERNEVIPLLISLSSITEGAIAFNAAKKYNMNTGRSSYITMCHDILVCETYYLKSVFFKDSNKDRTIALSYLSAAATGTYGGFLKSKPDQYTEGDVNVIKTNLVIGIVLGVTVSDLLETNRSIEAGLISTGVAAGYFLGEKQALRRDISNNDAYFLGLYSTAGSLVGFGTSLLFQPNNKDNRKLNLVLISAGSLAGYYSYDRKIGNKLTEEKKDKDKKFSLNTSINPIAFNTKDTILNFRLNF